MRTHVGRTSMLVAGVAGLVLVLTLCRGAGAGPLDTPGALTALPCSACHGFGGNSSSDTMPILAGIAPAYFKKAIQDYAEGKRSSPEMEPYAKQVAQFGVDDVAAYFASQTRQPTPVQADPAAVARGKALATQCVGCHGPEGKGDPAKPVPQIAGQPPGYLRSQLLLFKADQRSPADEPLKALKAVIKTIPDPALSDLAAYYSSLK